METGEDRALRALRHEGERVEQLLDELRGEAGAPLWQRIEEVVRRLLALHGAGLERLLALVAEGGALDDATLARLYVDGRVASLLLIHGLHPLPPAARIERAIAGALQRLRAPAGAARLLRLEGGVARLEIAARAERPEEAGGSEGPAPAVALPRSEIAAAVRRAIETIAPEVERVEVEGSGDGGAGERPAGSTLVQIRLPARREAGTEARTPKPTPTPTPEVAKVEAGCEICGVALPAEHGHVVEMTKRTIGCACRACALLFSKGGGRYRAIPERVLVDPELRITEDQWAALEIPVRTTFLFFNSTLKRWAAFYPSPAGAMESELALDAWADLAARSRLIQSAEPDVEALLVHGDRGASGLDCFLVPIDACYDLVGRVRSSWQGSVGGAEAWRAIDGFFDGLRRRSRILGGGPPSVAARSDSATRPAPGPAPGPADGHAVGHAGEGGP